MNSNNFYKDLEIAVKETASDCEIYKNQCDKFEYNLDSTIKESTLSEIPYIPWEFFKLSNNIFKELLRGKTFDNLNYWMESSSTTGDPSIVGRLGNDIEVLKSNYNDVFNSFSAKDQVNNLILFAPKMKFINKI